MTGQHCSACGSQIEWDESWTVYVQLAGVGARIQLSEWPVCQECARCVADNPIVDIEIEQG